MTVSQHDASRTLGQWEEKIAAVLGVPLPPDLDIKVVSADEFHSMKGFENTPMAGQVGHTIYISSETDPSQLAHFVVYEAAHAVASGPGTGDTVGAQGNLVGSKSAKAAEALAGVVTNRLGLTPAGWKPAAGAQTKIAALADSDLGRVAQATSSGNFSSVNDIAAPSGAVTNNNTPSETGNPSTTDTGDSGGLGGLGDAPPPADTGTDTANPADTRAGFLATLNAYQVPITSNLRQLIAKAVENGWGLDRFNQWLYKTPEFHDRFQGIFNPDGSLKMDPTQYLTNEQSYKDTASSAGINVNPGTIAWAIHNDVSPSEFADRAQAVRQLQSNPELYQQFGKALVQEGKANPGDINDQALTRFILGKGNKQWQDTWDLASARYSATQAGIQLQKGVDKYLALNPNLIQAIANKGLSPDALNQGFQEVAAGLLKDMPLAKIQGYGLTRKDLATAAFGGKASANVRATIEKIHAQESAFNLDRVTSQDYADASGNIGTVGNAQQRRAQTG